MYVSRYLSSPRKRILDVVVCLAVLGPALLVMLLVGGSVCLSDGRPVLLWQERVGRNRRLFLMPKFRTMHVCVGGSDRDVTRLGRFLRRHRLDELPQLLCVLTGDMSLVGPRPELADVVRTYQSRYSKRFAAVPGLTGLWQIWATRRKPIHDNIAYDFVYLRSASLTMDLRLILETLVFVVMPGRDQT